MAKSKLTYESAAEELQQIVEDLRSDDVTVDQMTVKVKRAAELISFCKEKLHTTEKQLNLLFDEEE